MLIHELSIIPINEAISVSHYADVVKTAIRDAIADCLSMDSPMSLEFGEWADRDIVATSLIDKFRVLRQYNDPDLYFSVRLSRSIRQALNKELKKDKVKYSNPVSSGQRAPKLMLQYVDGVLFQNIKFAGLADNSIIVLNKEQYLTPLVKIAFSKIQESFFNNQLVHEISPDDLDISDRMKEKPWQWYRVDWEGIRKHLDKNRVQIADKVLDEFPVDQMIDIILHELVHVIQHRQQQHRSQPEYRSYLDKKNNTLRQQWQGPEQGWNTEDTQWQRLYYASPQEIAAHAHNIAGRIIRSFGFDEPLEEPYPVVTAADFVRELRYIIGDQYRDPNNPRERAILNRYLKLAYQEVQRYLERKKAADKISEGDVIDAGDKFRKKPQSTSTDKLPNNKKTAEQDRSFQDRIPQWIANLDLSVDRSFNRTSEEKLRTQIIKNKVPAGTIIDALFVLLYNPKVVISDPEERGKISGVAIDFICKNWFDVFHVLGEQMILVSRLRNYMIQNGYTANEKLDSYERKLESVNAGLRRFVNTYCSK